MHVPAPTRVTVLPLTVQTPVVVEAKLTGSPDDAVADTVNGAAPNVLLPSLAKVIFWVASASATDTLCPTSAMRTMAATVLVTKDFKVPPGYRLQPACVRSWAPRHYGTVAKTTISQMD